MGVRCGVFADLAIWQTSRSGDPFRCGDLATNAIWLDLAKHVIWLIWHTKRSGDLASNSIWPAQYTEGEMQYNAHKNSDP